MSDPHPPPLEYEPLPPTDETAERERRFIWRWMLIGTGVSILVPILVIVVLYLHKWLSVQIPR